MLPTHLLLPIKHKDINYHSIYIAGASGNTVYLATRANPYYVWTIGYELGDPKLSLINWSKIIKIRKGARINADSLNIYLKDGNDARMFKTVWNDVTKVSIYNTLTFTASAQLSENTWVYRSIAKDTTNVFIKYGLVNRQTQIDRSLLQKQNEGIFSTDGTLIKIPHTPQFLYVYYYRNQFIRVDSNLKMIYKAKTIDTVSHAQIKVERIISNNQITIVTPPFLVNRYGSANDRYLFINSALKADNDSKNILEVGSIIDVYYLESGKYKFSFYIPNYKDKPPSDWQVHGNRLIAIYDTFLTIYQLNFK